jgi:tetratricopeptide (TPR) repeat protein
VDPETINAISGLWLLALIVLATVGIILFRAQIRNVLDTFTTLQFRRGETELSLSKETNALEAEAPPQAQAQERGVTEQLEVAEPHQEVLGLEEATSNDPFREMFIAFRNDGMKGGEEAFERLQETESNEVEKLRNEAVYLYLRYSHGDTAALEKLQDLAERANEAPDAKPTVFSYIGAAYKRGDDFLKAQEAYETAAETAQTEEQRAGSVVAAARCIFAAGNREEAYSRIMGQIGESDDSRALFTLYSGLASLYEQADDLELRAIALEKAIEFKPNDTQVRFDAAYSYSENDFDSLSLMHYRTLLDFTPENASALNNLGVIYGELQMQIKRANSYKEAWGHGETLAAANLANDYISVGLIDEAMDILNEAKQGEDVHPNVGSALATVDHKKETESKKETGALNTAHEQRQYLLSFAEAYFSERSVSPGFEGNWRLPDGVEVTVARSDDKLKINWERRDQQHTMTAQVQGLGARISDYTRPGYYTSRSGADGFAYLSELAF